MLLAAAKVAYCDIRIAPDAHQAVCYAAEELQRYIFKMTQAFPQIRANAEPIGPREIFLGDCRQRAEFFPEIDDAKIASLAREDYLLWTRGNHLLVLGGSPRAVLYGVYDLLERMGVCWWAPGEETVPMARVLDLAPLQVEVRPPLIYRATWYHHAMPDPDWQARVRLNAGAFSPPMLRERHGVLERYAADAGAHTYDLLVPTDTYFDAHPEYYSEVNGIRLRHLNQLCATNPDVADIAAESARRWLDDTPGSRIVSVTQNDWGNWCACPDCAALAAREGSTSALALHLANEVARRLEATHPEALVDNFAYDWSEAAPRTMQAHPQILMRIAPIGNCFGHPIRTCAHNLACREAVESWSRVAQHLFVWHYVTDFVHYLPPFPNLPPLQDDINFYLEHGVKGLFLQGNGTSPGGDMAEMKAWLFARLMWDPAQDLAALRWEFLRGYYRDAAPAVQAYLEIFERAFLDRGDAEHLHLYRSLWANEASYLQPPVLKRARAALRRAQALADGADVLFRLERIEMSLDYTELFYYERPGRRRTSPATVDCPVTPRRREMAQRFFAAVDRHRVTHYSEDLGRYTTTQQLRQAWLQSIGSHRAWSLRVGDSEAMVVPALGGRIVSYGPRDGEFNILGVSSPDSFGYPCAGGYEEYSERVYQSPGFSDAFRVLRRSAGRMVLQATLENALELTRDIRLTPEAVVINSSLRNPSDVTLPGCARGHVEIDLGVPVGELQLWVHRQGEWSSWEVGPTGPVGNWFESETPDGWLYWAERTRRGFWHRWRREQITAVHVSGIPVQPTALTLDIAMDRFNHPLAPGDAFPLDHAFGWLRDPRPLLDTPDWGE